MDRTKTYRKPCFSPLIYPSFGKPHWGPDGPWASVGPLTLPNDPLFCGIFMAIHGDLTQKMRIWMGRHGSGIVLGFSFFPVWGICFGFTVLSIFLAICSILNLEAAISTVLAAFWTSNLSLSIVFASFSWNLQHFGTGSSHFSGFDFMIVPQFSLILTWFSLICLKFWLIFGSTRCANYKLFWD